VLRLPLPEGYTVLIDDADQMLVAGFPWRVLQTDNSDLLYAHAWNNRMHLYMHRLILGAGPREQVDHWNGCGLDNQRHNLRSAAYPQNRANQGKQLSRSGRMSTSRYKGVCWDRNRNRWMASIHVNGKTRSLGRFDDEELAARAYDESAIEHWGQFARLNFPVDNGVICGLHQLGIEHAPCVCERTGEPA
jgi:AP2 domain